MKKNKKLSYKNIFFLKNIFVTEILEFQVECRSTQDLPGRMISGNPIFRATAVDLSTRWEKSFWTWARSPGSSFRETQSPEEKEVTCVYWKQKGTNLNLNLCFLKIRASTKTPCPHLVLLPSPSWIWVRLCWARRFSEINPTLSEMNPKCLWAKEKYSGTMWFNSKAIWDTQPHPLKNIPYP